MANRTGIKTGGRKMGSQNLVTKEISDFILNFVNSNLDTIQKDLDNLQPKERLQFIAMLLKFILPTQIKNTLDLDNKTGGVIIIDWNESKSELSY